VGDFVGIVIAICDDTELDLKLLDMMLKEYCRDRKIPAEIYPFTSGHDLLQSKKNFDIIFMDIYLKGESGIQIARQYSGAHTQIVFASASREHAIEAFNMDAAHYLVKPFSIEQVAEAMTRCMNHLSLLPICGVPVHTASGDITIPMDSISFIEVFNKVSVIHTRSNEIETKTGLSTLYSLLDPNIFLRVERSYVVNMFMISKMLSDHVVLKSGHDIPMSRKNHKDLQTSYQKFVEAIGREKLL
jgi:DNA-binding LytR/AlgR family response regulator